MKNEKLEALTDEIRKLREEVKELREAGQWPRIQYVPYPQPSYVPWWGTTTIAFTPCQTTTSVAYVPTSTTQAWLASGNTQSVGL